MMKKQLLPTHYCNVVDDLDTEKKMIGIKT